LRARGVDDPWAAARAMASQATLAEHRSEHVHATALAREALAVQLQIGDQLGAVETLERLASIAVHDKGERAAQLLGAAATQRERLGAPLPLWRRSKQQGTAGLARIALGEARYAANVRQGRELSLEQAATRAARAP